MRILFISNGFPPHRWAGTETHTAAIAEGLLKGGHSVQVLCAGDWEGGSKYWNGFSDDVYHDVRVRRLHLDWTLSPDPFRYLYDNPVVASYLEGYLGHLRPDIVHVTSCETLSASVLGVVKRSGVPLVLSLTDFWFLCPRLNLLRSDGENCSGNTTPWDCLRCQLLHTNAYRWSHRLLPDAAARRVLTFASKRPVLTRQRGLRGYAGDMGARKAFLERAIRLPERRLTASPFVRDVFVANEAHAPITVQPYGHDLSWLHRFPGKRRALTLRLGYIGQIFHHKGVHLLIEAVRRLPADRGVELAIYGDLSRDPAYGASLRTLAGGAPNITFCGTYPHDQSGNVFANLDLLVVPSLWYDFPLIVYEAFATGTPVVATALGGMAEVVVHDANGLLFERGSVESLARQLGRLLDEPSLLDRLCRGVPAVKRIEQEVGELQAIYGDLAGRRATARRAPDESVCMSR